MNVSRYILSCVISLQPEVPISNDHTRIHATTVASASPSTLSFTGGSARSVRGSVTVPAPRASSVLSTPRLGHIPTTHRASEGPLLPATRKLAIFRHYSDSDYCMTTTYAGGRNSSRFLGCGCVLQG